MEHAKYSKQEFDRLGLDSPEAQLLAEQLQDDVMQELHRAILPVVQAIAPCLNALGHSLTVSWVTGSSRRVLLIGFTSSAKGDGFTATEAKNRLVTEETCGADLTAALRRADVATLPDEDCL